MIHYQLQYLSFPEWNYNDVTPGWKRIFIKYILIDQCFLKLKIWIHTTSEENSWSHRIWGFEKCTIYGRVDHLWGKILKTKKPLPRGGIWEFLNKNFTGGLQTAQRVFWLKRIFDFFPGSWAKCTFVHFAFDFFTAHCVQVSHVFFADLGFSARFQFGRENQIKKK